MLLGNTSISTLKLFNCLKIKGPSYRGKLWKTIGSFFGNDKFMLHLLWKAPVNLPVTVE